MTRMHPDPHINAYLQQLFKPGEVTGPDPITITMERSVCCALSMLAAASFLSGLKNVTDGRYDEQTLQAMLVADRFVSGLDGFARNLPTGATATLTYKESQSNTTYGEMYLGAILLSQVSGAPLKSLMDLSIVSGVKEEYEKTVAAEASVETQPAPEPATAD